MTEYDGTHVDAEEARESLDQTGESLGWPEGKARTYGVSPKVVAASATALVVWVVAGLGLELPEGVVAALQVLLAAVAGWLAPAGCVEFDG